MLPDPHADAVILPFLVFAELGEGLRVKEARMGIKGSEHAWDGSQRAVLRTQDRLVGIDCLGIVLLHQVVDSCKGVEAAAYVRLVAVSGGIDTLAVNTSQQCTQQHRR